MTSIAFQPWVGSSYNNQKTRLLLVGDSHYGEPDEDPSQGTRTVVEKWKREEWNIRYLVAAGRVLTGLQRWQFKRSEVLEHIAFYNFVQVMMPWHNIRPTAEQFRASVAAMSEAISTLDPTHILVTGKEVWWYMPPEGPVEAINLASQAASTSSPARPFSPR